MLRSFKSKKIAIFLIFPFLSSCASIPSSPWPQKQGYMQGIYVGIGYAPIKKNNLSQAREIAFNDALRKLGSSNEIFIKSYIKNYTSFKKGVLREDLESYVSVSMYKVLGTKRFEEKIDPDGHYWVRVWMTEEDFEKSLQRTFLIREKEFLRARDYYEIANSYESHKALEKLRWYEKAKRILEDIHATNDVYRNKDGHEVILYALIEKEYFEAKKLIDRANLLYQQAEQELKNHNLETAKKKLKEAFSMVEDHKRHYEVESELKVQQASFESYYGDAERFYDKGNYSTASRYYQKAMEVNKESDAKEKMEKSNDINKKKVKNNFKRAFAIGLSLLLAAGLIVLASSTPSGSSSGYSTRYSTGSHY